MAFSHRLKQLEQAAHVLREREVEALDLLIDDNSPENRARFREIHETHAMIHSDMTRHQGLFVTLLKRLVTGG